MTDKKGVTRRQFLAGISTAAAASVVDAGMRRGETRASDAPAYRPSYFTAAEWAFVNAAVARLIPEGGAGPGGVSSGVPEFIDRQLELPYGYGAYYYMQGPFVPDAPATLGYQLKYTPRELYRLGIAAIERHCMQQWGKPFEQLSAEEQDRLLVALEKGFVPLEGPPAAEVFAQLLANTREGYFADPLYGGNRGMAAWKYIGFPGARADFTDWLDQAGHAYPYGPVSINGKSDRA